MVVGTRSLAFLSQWRLPPRPLCCHQNAVFHVAERFDDAVALVLAQIAMEMHSGVLTSVEQQRLQKLASAH